MSDNANVVSITDAAKKSTHWRPLRIWPPAILLLGMIVFRLLPSMIEDAPANIWMSAAFGPALCGLLILIWWVAASRATMLERISGFAVILFALFLTLLLMDSTMRGPAVTVLTIPCGMAAFAIGAILFHRMLSFRRTVIALLMASLGFGVSTLFRTDGMWGNFALGLHPRWLPSSETIILKAASHRRKARTAETDFAEGLAQPAWPGFRGSNRDAQQHGSNIATNWDSNPPQQKWKMAVGPGWSSFVVAGEMLFTQEQRVRLKQLSAMPPIPASKSGHIRWNRDLTILLADLARVRHPRSRKKPFLSWVRQDT